MANDATSYRPDIGASFKFGVLFTLLLLYGLRTCQVGDICLFPSTYYCYRYYLMGNSYHGVSDRWLCTPEDVGYVFDVTVKGYF